MALVAGRILWDVDTQRVVNRDQNVEEIDRIDVQLITHIDVCCEGAEVGFGGDRCQGAQDGRANLISCHSFSGVCSRRSMAARNRPPR